MKKITKIKIIGMTCSGCEVRIERKFMAIPGILKAKVSHVNGKAIITHENDLNLRELENLIRQDGYRISLLGAQANPDQTENKNDILDFFNVGAIFIVIIAIYLITKELGLIPKNFGISDGISYGFVFLIGLIASASSCLAVTGGLLLAVSSEWAERNPEMTGWQKFKPLLLFNAGRLFFYGVLGGIVGAIGSAIKLSPRIDSVIIILAGLVMFALGLHLLHLFPWANHMIPKMPKFLAHKIHDYERHNHPFAPFLLGGATFFLPCGFTQALQLYALSAGSFKTGALTMFIFALGTLPALLSISAISSFIQGTVKRYFFRVAGALIIIMAIFNVKSGIVLSGIDVKAWLPSPVAITTNVEMTGDKQIAKMSINGLDYSPSHFIVKKGVPVEWQIDAGNAAGCARYIVMPQFGIQRALSGGVETISFTPEKTGRLYFSCPMGMTTPWAVFEVVD